MKLGAVSLAAVCAVTFAGWAWWNANGGDGSVTSPELNHPSDNSEAVSISGSANNRSLTAIPTSLPQKTPQQLAAERAEREAQQKQLARQQSLTQTLQPYLTKYCADCHGPDSQEAGIDVTQLASVDQFLTEHGKWERVYRMINAGAMPPADYAPFPQHSEQQNIAELLSEELYNFDCDLVYNPGRPTVQRLNRAEYNNTIRDLLGVSISPADDFPADDVGEGFDNIGDVLSLPPLLMEKYLNAAEQVAAAVIDTTDYSKPQTVTLNAEALKSDRGKAASGGDLWLATNGTIQGSFDIVASGQYEVRIVAQAQQMGQEKARFALSVNDKRIQEMKVISDRKRESFSHALHLETGTATIATTFLNDDYDGAKKQDRNFAVSSITLFGPVGGGTPVRSAAHQRFVTQVPGNGQSVENAARIVLKPVLQRAFRRPVSDSETDRYASLVTTAVDDMGESYEAGLSMALQAILVSSDFLFRLEQDPAPGQPERSIDDFELASRLSYFLWSSMPDDELFELARFGKLSTEDVLRQQVRRMLVDPKAEALVQNFAAQWLNLRNLENVSPDPSIFRSFNNDLRQDMRRETELLFKTVLQEDRSVEELLSADFTFVNKRLAEHYGIQGVNGDEFERVSLTNAGRSGVLTHASILTLTSNPGRTSPVKRGKWIMENIFGEAPPPAPPNVPELEETAKAAPNATLREQLAKHREDPGCASCHNAMDPLGLGFENFDAIGRWRDTDDGKPIDATGTLPTGESFNGSTELIRIIQQRRERFSRTLADKMLVYAIGRGTEYYDKCAVDDCLDLMKRNSNRFSSLVEGVVLSDPFRKRAAPATNVATK